MPFDGLDCDALHGIELWSFVTDTAEAVESIPGLVRFVALPGRALEHPPERNMHAWDELCSGRRVVAIGGLDAHQFGKRIGRSRAASDHGLPALVSLHPHARPVRRAAERRPRPRP